MVKTCKYAEQNRKEGKCMNYFISHSKGSVMMCRLTEWKKKIGVCPYDKTIYSPQIKLKKAIKDKKQRTLKNV